MEFLEINNNKDIGWNIFIYVLVNEGIQGTLLHFYKISISATASLCHYVSPNRIRIGLSADLVFERCQYHYIVGIFSIFLVVGAVGCPYCCPLWYGLLQIDMHVQVEFYARHRNFKCPRLVEVPKNIKIAQNSVSPDPSSDRSSRSLEWFPKASSCQLSKTRFVHLIRSCQKKNIMKTANLVFHSNIVNVCLY